MNEIQNLRFNGVEFDKMHSGYWNLNALTYTQEPTRSADGTIPDINNIETFYVPRLWVDFKMLTLAEYQELMAVINKPSFDIEYFDAEKSKFVVNNFYLSPLERNELYNKGANIVGVENFNLEFIGTLNEPTNDLSLFELTIDTRKVSSTNKIMRIGEQYFETYDYYINWGDETEIQHIQKTTGTNSAHGIYYTEHIYAIAGEYKIQIYGSFPAFYTDSTTKNCLLSINYWGQQRDNLNDYGLGWILCVGAFDGCSNLSSLPKDYAYRPDTVKTLVPLDFIDEYAFKSTKLSKVIIPSNCDSIEKFAFAGCTQLTEVDFNNKSNFVKNSAFVGCTNLITLNNTLNIQQIGDYCFESCTSLIEIIVGENLSGGIGNYAFSEDTNFNKITIYSNSVPTLGLMAFSSTGITSSSGNIYVPTASVSAYQAATNWSTYSSRISAITNTVTLNGNGGTISASGDWTGSGDTATKTVTYTLAVGTIPTSSEIAYTGYTFGGWNTASDGTGTTYTSATLYQVKGNLTLYAKWIAV